MIDVPKDIFEYGWGRCYEFRRILQILWDYWISEKDEEFVYVEMYFRQKNGMEQGKRITWVNCKSGEEEPSLRIPDSANEENHKDKIFKIASSMQSLGGASDDVILSTCQGYNEKYCNPPLDDDEIKTIVENVINRYQKGQQKKGDGGTGQT